MKKRAFDILPPYKEETRTYHRESPKKKEKRKARSLFLTIVLLVFLLSLFYVFIKAAEINSNSTSNNKISNSNDFELFDTYGNSSFTQKTSIATVRILNASPETNNAIWARDALLKNNFTIEKVAATDKTANAIIYYSKYSQENKLFAEKAKEVISAILPTEIRESQDKYENYQLLVVVGSK